MTLKIFDERTITRFALFPTLLDDGNKVWLRRYKVLQFFGCHYAGLKPTVGSKAANPRLSENQWIDLKTWK